MGLAPRICAFYRNVEVVLDYPSFTEEYFISLIVLNEVCSHYILFVYVCVCVCSP